MATKVNEKSTKTEIWDAYKQLLSEVQSRPVAITDDPARLQKMVEALAEAKAALVGRFESTIERVTATQQSYAEADQDLARRKATAIESIEQGKQQLETTIESVRKQWEQEKADHELQRQRDEDTYQYNLTRKRRDEQEAYDRKASEREAALASRETELAKREQTVEELTKQVDAFPAQLEAAVKSAKEEVTKTLNSEHTAELKDVKQLAAHEKSILELKLQTAETTIASQAKQIADLQRQLDASSAQLKDMAVTVIQAKNAPAPSAPQQQGGQ